MCSFGRSTRISLSLTDFPAISEFECRIMIAPTADLDSEHVRRGVENSRGIPGGNTRRRFHGTVRECCLGDTSSENALCRLSTCNLCRIIQVPLERAAGPLWYLASWFYRARSNSLKRASAQTSADSERVSIRLRPHQRFARSMYLGGSEALICTGQ
jgi:hypothetical protein